MKLLVVEDDERTGQLLQRGLTEEGHQVDRCIHAVDAERQAKVVGYDVIVLDWGLPDVDGVALLRRWRDAGLATPVLMLTARGSVGERVTGLRAGADDYLVKPFDFDELIARIEALHRRAAGVAMDRVGDLVIDVAARMLVCGARREALTNREWQLWLALAEHRGDVLTRSQLLAKVWGAEFDGEPNVVDVYIGYVRGKLAKLGTKSVHLRAVRGLGYRLEVG